MKRIIAFILCLIAVITLTVPLTSCDRSYNEEEVLSAAEELIAKSAELNEIFWGRGIGYDRGDLSSSIGNYYKANFFDLDKYGVRTVEDIKEKARGVFTEKYCENIFSTVFYSIVDTEIQFYARYFQKYSDENNTEPECIMVYSEAIVLLDDTVVYHYDTMRVTGSKRESVFVSIDVTVTSPEGEVQTNTLNIGLIEEEDGWRINTPTYSSYNKYKDEENNTDK